MEVVWNAKFGNFSQCPVQQPLPKQANMSAVQGNSGENSQIQFFNFRGGMTPLMMQGSPQSQSVRNDRAPPATSDQGMLPIGALGGNPAQSTDLDINSGSMTSSANTIIWQQSFQGADLLTQSLGNYLITSPQDRNVMAAQVCRQPSSC
jgi:hypothetical protein